MPESRFSAQEEIMRRIRSLDAEEDMWERRAVEAETQRLVATSEAKKIGNTRRQYEYALQALGVEKKEIPKPRRKIPIESMPADPVAVKVGQGVIAEL